MGDKELSGGELIFPKTIIAGCGNPLFADDGFGPAVVRELQQLVLPKTVVVLDAGTSANYFLFPLLDTEVTEAIILIDSIDFRARPGSIARFGPEPFPFGRLRDAHPGGIAEWIHHLSNRYSVTLVGCQPCRVTYPYLEIGLSEEVKNAVPEAVKIVLELLQNKKSWKKAS
ncbi:coenzyme F420-reducing hydrogenase, FrhD protein [Methanoregula sp.]|uniref:coenzyme F420-reducing hydrogenase, FrhD protein n=1 Tax=Methanoregula sp. TaxID=2052170 RepID=UPI000CBEEC81|nr:coenzyme F420-reducing hydrogenase, FrhD protein [Methanoregula sp.]PKG32078.1 MAG: coenzyme F420-reducing hydrogenase, FrhD protein [Methanoregula sp.]